MATRYLVPGGDGNYNSTSNWSATDGGASGATFPVAADDIIINANSLNAPLVINVVSACKSFNASSYTGTVSMNSDLSVEGIAATGDITLSSGMTITGTGTFAKKGTSTTGRITSNGAIFDCNFSFTNIGTCTTLINGTMQVNKNLSSTLNAVNITTINTGKISVGGDVIHNNPLGGTSTIELIGTTPATITQVPGRYLQTNLIINKGAGVFNQVDLYWTNRTLTYTSGIVNHTGILFTTTGATLNTTGITWNILTHQSNILNFTSVFNADSIICANASSFRGTFGFNVNTFQCIAGAGNVEFSSGFNYTINSSITIVNTGNGTLTVRAQSAGNTILNIKETAFMKFNKVTVQKITASNKTIRVVNSTKDAACVNVFLLTSNINPYSTTR